MQENYKIAVQAFIEMIINGYGQSDVEQFTPEDFAENLGIEIDQENMNKALDEAIEKTCAYNNEDFYNN